MVVAYVESQKIWILAEVVNYNPITKKYGVDDIDDEQTERHIVKKHLVIPLPLQRANPETDESALFRSGTEGKHQLLLRYQ